MALIDTARPTRSFAFSRLAALPARLRQWNEERLTRAALSRLTDQELDDIGLSRGDIAEMGSSRGF